MTEIIKNWWHKFLWGEGKICEMQSNVSSVGTKKYIDPIFEKEEQRMIMYERSHTSGTRVAAKSKDGTWKKGVIIGQHDWSWFTLYFTIEFEDGEIIKQSEHNVTKL